MFAEHAAGAVAAERELHAELLGDLGVDPDDLGAPAPATQAYVSYLAATVHAGSYAEAVAAMDSLMAGAGYDGANLDVAAYRAEQQRYTEASRLLLRHLESEC